MDALLPTNFSLYALPAYYLLSLYPHMAALRIATNNRPTTWDNRNPRAVELKANLQAKLPRDTYLKWERAEAASANAFENQALFFGAVIVGNVVGLEKSMLNRFAARFLVARALHTLSYLMVSRQRWTYFRTLAWVWSVAEALRVFVLAANMEA